MVAGAVLVLAGASTWPAAATSGGAALASRAAADEPAIADIVPRLDRTTFATALSSARLERSERDLMLALYDDYQSTLLGLADILEDRRIAAGRDRYDAAIAGRVRLDPAEIAVLRRDIALADLETWAPAVAALADLVEMCGFALEPDASARLSAELPGLRRAAFLGALAGTDASRLEAGESVDLERLALAAARQELTGVSSGSIQAILAGWSAAIDPGLGTVVGEIRAARVERRIARTARDPRAIADADGRLVAAWRTLAGPTEAASRRIEDLARNAGGEGAAAAWRDRVRRASFPWLFESVRRPRLAADWIGRNVTDAAIVAEARQLAAAWSDERTKCDDETIALVLEAREDLERIIHPRSNLALLGGGRPADIFRELLRLSGRAEQLDRGVEESIAALLSPDDRRRMRSDLRAMMLRR